MKKRALLMSALALALLLSGCKKKPQYITVEELQGDWYASNSSAYETITFEEDRYSCGNFLPEGTFQVNKEGLVKLIDKYRAVETLTPVKKDGTWVLEYEQLYSKIIFTQAEVVPPPPEDVGESAEHIGDPSVRDVILSTINQFLAGVEWETKAGEQVRYENGVLSVDNRDPIEFNFTDAQITSDGKYIFFATSKDGSYRGEIMETPVDDGEYLYEFTLRLNGDTILVTSKQCEPVSLIDQ